MWESVFRLTLGAGRYVKECLGKCSVGVGAAGRSVMLHRRLFVSSSLCAVSICFRTKLPYYTTGSFITLVDTILVLRRNWGQVKRSKKIDKQK